MVVPCGKNRTQSPAKRSGFDAREVSECPWVEPNLPKEVSRSAAVTESVALQQGRVEERAPSFGKRRPTKPQRLPPVASLLFALDFGQLGGEHLLQLQPDRIDVGIAVEIKHLLPIPDQIQV
jgi:hypothetical protein